jgi:hypothetical protein
VRLLYGIFQVHASAAEEVAGHDGRNIRMAKEIVVIDGVKYDAEKRAAYDITLKNPPWVVRRFIDPSVDDPGEAFMEAEVWPPPGVTWTAKDAVQAAIKGQHWT